MLPTLGVALAPDLRGAARLPGAAGALHAGPARRRRALRRRGARPARGGARDGVVRRGARRRRARRDASAWRSSRASSAGGSRSALLVALPLAAAVGMRGSLPGVGAAGTHRERWSRSLANRRLFGVAVAGGALFFTFVGTFTYVIYRLEAPPYSYGTSAASLVFLLWIAGVIGPLAGRVAERLGWRRLAGGDGRPRRGRRRPHLLLVAAADRARARVRRHRDVHGLHRDAARRERRGACRPGSGERALLQHLLRSRGARRLSPRPRLGGPRLAGGCVARAGDARARWRGARVWPDRPGGAPGRQPRTMRV